MPYNRSEYVQDAEQVARDLDTSAFLTTENTLEHLGAALDQIASENGQTTLKSFSVRRSAHGYLISVTTSKTRYISRPR